MQAVPTAPDRDPDERERPERKADGDEPKRASARGESVRRRGVPIAEDRGRPVTLLRPPPHLGNWRLCLRAEDLRPETHPDEADEASRQDDDRKGHAEEIDGDE